MFKIMSCNVQAYVFYCSRLCLVMFKIMFCKVQDYVLYLAFCRMQTCLELCKCCGSVRAAWHWLLVSYYFNGFRRWANGANLFLLTLHESWYHLQLGQRQTPFGAHLGIMGFCPSYFFPHLLQDGNWQCLQRSARFVALRLAQSFSHLGFPQDLQVGPQYQDLKDLRYEARVRRSGTLRVNQFLSLGVWAWVWACWSLYWGFH